MTVGHPAPTVVDWACWVVKAPSTSPAVLLSPSNRCLAQAVGLMAQPTGVVTVPGPTVVSRQWMATQPPLHELCPGQGIRGWAVWPDMVGAGDGGLRTVDI